MTKTLSLDQVELTFDPATANILLTSADHRLSGSLKLTISSQTESYRTLLKLLAAEDAADLDGLGLPSGTIRMDSARDLWVPNRDPRFWLRLGRGQDNRSMEVDLRRNLLVTGRTGAGKSVMLRSVICSGLEQDDVEIRAIDLRRVSLGSYAFRPQDRVAFTEQSALELLRDLHAEMEHRREGLDTPGFRYPKEGTDLGYPVTYLVIDELWGLTRLAESSHPDAEEWNARVLETVRLLSELARFGRAVGICLVVATQSAGLDVIPQGLMVELFDRILMGPAKPAQVEELFGRRATSFGAAYLMGRGRGQGNFGSSGKQEVFQAFFIPYDGYRARVGS